SAISSAFDALSGNSHVDKIIVSDSSTNEVTISAAQAASDTTALNELKQANGTSIAHVAVSDTASAISSAFDALSGNSHVDKIIVNDSTTNEVTITVAQLSGDTTALSELKQSDGTTAAHVKISDSAANISAAFDALNSNTQVDKIVISPTAALTLSASQVAGDTTALGEIQGSYTIHVSDTAADITTYLDALHANGHVTQIVVSDNAEITVSIAQLSSDSDVIGDLQNQDASTVHVIVADTAANIATALDSLNGNALVNAIVVSDSGTNEVTITAAQAAADTTALNELKLANGSTMAHVAVSDTASAISTAFDALNGNSHVDKIIVSDSGGGGEVRISVAQAASDTTALSELKASDGSTMAHVAVLDTAVNITNALDTLNGYGQVDKIIVSNDIAPQVFTEVRASVNQLTTDATALSELYYSDGTTHAKVAVYDTASNISAALSSLNGNAQVDHIIISDNAAITVSAADAVNDATALSELQNANGSPVTLGVLDTAANITTYLDQLNGESNISLIVISDNQPLTLTAVQIGSDTSALGKLADADSSGVEINVVDNAANISANLTALQSNPDIISITVSDSAPITVTVAQITSDAVVLSELQNADSSPVLLTVDDTAANIRANLASLNQNADITSIMISNNGVLLLTVAQLSADSHALSIMHNQNGTPYQLRISDNASNISNALDTLSANSHIKTITVTDSAAITLNIAQITSDATALSELANANSTPYTLSVRDVAATVSSSFDALNANSHVAKITVTDSASQEVVISATQFTTDTRALSELYQANGTALAHVQVSDAASAITTALNGLSASSQVDKIVVTDSASHEVQVTVAQIASDSTALAELFKADGTTHATITVADTASAITTAFDTLNSNTQVDKIIVNNSASSEVVISIAQITTDATALAELYKADGSAHATVTVSDTVSDIAAALGSLNSNSQVDKIIVSDSNSAEINVNVAGLGTYATALGELYNADGTSHAHVSVTDVAATISSNFNLLGGDSQVNKIIVSDSSSNEVTISVAQLTSDAAAVAELYQANGTTLAHVAINDTAANISTAFDSLNGNSHVDKIVVSNSGSAEVAITVSQAKTDTVALGELYNADGTTPAHITVSDTAANISANINLLQNFSQADHIVISDGNPLILTASQVINDTIALGKIVGAYSVNVLDTAAHISNNLDALEANGSITLVTVSDDKLVSVNIAQLSTDANVLGVMVDATSGTAAALKVLDTAANIQANLGNLKADLSLYNFSVITISDNAAITLTAAQFETDSTVLADLRNADKSAVNLIVSDTAAHLQASLDDFQAYNSAHPLSKISSIVVSNSAALTISTTQLSADAQILGEITNRNGSNVAFKVVDTAAKISAALNAMQANGHISSVTISDNLAIALSLSQMAADATVISKLHNLDNSPYTLHVTDTAANISSALSALNGNSHVTQVIVSDSATHEVHATVLQLTNDTTLFSELYQADGTSHAHVTLSDTAAHIDALSATAIASLATEGVDTIDASNNKLMLNLAQYEAIANNAIKLTAADNVTVTDTASAFAAASTAELSALGTNGVDKVVLTGSGEFALDHWAALDTGVASVTTTGASITIDGTSGSDTINTAGTGNFTLNGGAGSDTFNVSTAGHDTFVYGAASESTSTGYDTITGYNTATDLFQVANHVTGVDTQVMGALNTATFDADMAAAIGSGQLGADHAVLFKVTSGSLSGHTFLIVDQNGVAGYQSGGDLVIDVTGGLHLTNLNTGDFTTST
ncbi:MAG TPA: bluetail domain-containing putative surface protein, partial [Rhizomicrobium sp.]|nr:bluetail domain-containing putative surface protein [Rhizomicrobium sp.]